MVIVRIYTESELLLVKDTMLSGQEIAELLGVSKITVFRLRKKLNVVVSRGAKKYKLNPKKMRQVTRTCIGKNCTTSFTVNQASQKKYCSHSCQAKTACNLPKGPGSRRLRNPNMPEYRRYSRLVHGLSHKTYIENIDIINPHRYPRTLCGVEGGWQLDHIRSIKDCFRDGVSATEASAIDNLRMLPWKDNLMRQYIK